MKLIGTFPLHLLISLVSLTIQQGEDGKKVRVFSLQKGVWHKGTDDVFVRYNFTKSDRTTHALTICYRIRFEVFLPSTTHFSYAVSDDSNTDPLSLGHRDDIISSWIWAKPYEVKVPNSRIVPQVWYPICHALDIFSYALYWKGKMIHRWSSPLAGPMPLNGSIVLGQEQDMLGGGFDSQQITRGDIAQVSIWDRLLNAATIRDIANCTSLARGNIFSTDTSEVEVLGAVETWVDVEELCRETPHYVILPEMRTHKNSQALCDLFSATLPVPSSDRENQALTKKLLPFSDVCVPTAKWKLWLGAIANPPGTWREMSTQRKIKYQPFSKTSTIIDPILTCTALQDDGLWIAEYCEDTTKRCTACDVNHTSILAIRGLCFDAETHTWFRIETIVGERPIFRGHFGLVISWNMTKKKWELSDPHLNTTLLWALGVSSDAYPIGLQSWMVVSEICGMSPGKTMPLSLSKCSEREFMCSSGHCIAHHQRCNFHYDCDDLSDERNCQVVQVVDDFQRQMPPTGKLQGFLKLKAFMTIIRIASVDDLNMAVTVEFQFTLNWTDHRLKLKHLREGRMLSKEDSNRVWRPTLTILSLDGGELTVLGQSFMITPWEEPVPAGFNDVEMDLVYPGISSTISFTQRYSIRIACYFVLYLYPFDTQTCSIHIQLPPESGESVVFSEGGVNYTGPRTLAMYTVKEIGIVGSSPNQFKVEFGLSRRQGVILLSTFLPSALLLLVSWSTLFIKLEALNVRAIMSLTTLLVLYTLFTNMSSSLPPSASIKLIDVWFFFIIFLLFINIVVHIFIDYKRDVKNIFTPKKIFVGKKPTPIATQQKQTTTTTVPSPLKDTYEQSKNRPTPKFLMYYRTIILPIIILVFNVIFWTAVFVQ